MKKNYLKLLSASVAAFMIAGSMGAYATDTKLDYNVENGKEQSFSDDGGVILSENVLDYSVENSIDYQQVAAEQKEYEVSLMSDFDPVMFRGKGTEASPYLISTVEELLSVAVWVNNGAFTDAYYKLENDIDLGGAEWTPIGDYQNSVNYTYAFKGTFDGNGKTVSNFKITEPQIYAGFFGLVNNGTIKNLTVSDFNIDVEYAANYMYVGGLVARMRAIGDEAVATIDNCHVRNANINAKSSVRVYGSGHSGYLHSSENANLIINNCSTDANVNFAVNVYDTSASDRSMIRAGGLIGYVGITDGFMEITDSYSNAVLVTDFTDSSANANNNIHAGGFAGDFSLDSSSTSSRSKLTIDSCYSTNMVYAKADGDVYAGGFSGYFVSSASDVELTNCHTSSSVYTYSTSNTSYIGGFTSIAGIASDEPEGTIKLNQIYVAGNVIDINSKDCYGGKIVGYIEGEADFTNSFIMKDSILVSKNNTKKENKILKDADLPGTVFDKETASDVTNYIGFDIDVWKNGSAPYTYPVLISNEIVTGNYSFYYYSEEAPVLYKTGLTYGDTPVVPDVKPDSNYVFSHWSLYKNGTDITSDNTTVTSDFIVFPNNSTEYKSYNIYFIANGETFETKEIKYNSPVTFPENVPVKPADSLFRYAFSHWAYSENGSAIDISKETVKGSRKYYAVYKKVETGVWDGVSTTSYTSGNGTAESPYEISDAYQLAYLAQSINNGTASEGAHYILVKDIDLGGYEWTPIGTEEHPFIGTISGNGYCIYNFKITEESTLYAGLFGYVKNADISKIEVSGLNISIDNTDRNTKYHAGAIVAYAVSDGSEAFVKISECHAEGKIDINGSIVYAGGIAGYTGNGIVSAIYIENCYTNVEISINTVSNSTAGGIVGKFEAKNKDISYIDRCYSTGNISALSDVSGYVGGIVGIITCDDMIGLSGEDDVMLMAVSESGTIRNSFTLAKKISLSLGHSSYGGAVYGWKNSVATVANCGYDKDALVITASKIADDKNVTSISKGFDDTEENIQTYLSENYGFDFENVWAMNNELPVLKVFNQVKNVFRINDFSLDVTDGTVDVELKMCNRDVESYTVFLGAYDERGKMIGFNYVNVSTPSELQTIELNLTGVNTAEYTTLSVINPETLILIENPVVLTK